MPEITIIGWLHTLAGALAILVGVYSLIKQTVFEFKHASARLYMGLTLFTAITALLIYQHGKFNIAHALAVLTLLALASGFILEKRPFLGGLSRYLQAISYSATLLFHLIPAITDGLRRLPVNDPIVDSIEAPLLKQFYLGFFVLYLSLVVYQILWLKKRNLKSE